MDDNQQEQQQDGGTKLSLVSLDKRVSAIEETITGDESSSTSLAARVTTLENERNEPFETQELDTEKGTVEDRLTAMEDGLTQLRSDVAKRVTHLGHNS